MPMVYPALSPEPMSIDQLHVAVPVFRSARFTRPTPVGTHAVGLDAVIVEVLLYTNFTVAFLISPAFGSYDGSPDTAVMSWMVALSVTLAELEVADDVEANIAPV